VQQEQGKNRWTRWIVVGVIVLAIVVAVLMLR
jgi:hypothetical protein